MSLYRRILVIRLGAFGDIVRSFPTLAALRQHYPEAEITLLTLRPFAALVEGSPYVDQVWTIDRWPWHRVGAWWRFARRLRRAGFDCVYDIQRNDRTWLMSLLAPSALRRKWYDRKRGAFFYDPGALAASNIRIFPPADMAWLDADIGGFGIAPPFVLMVPGGAPQHPQKRWPAGHYAALAEALAERGYRTALLGTAAEAGVLEEIVRAAPGAVNLGGRTSFNDIAALARAAAVAIGNDTGPMHLISAVGCPVVSLFSGVSRPEQSAPMGTSVKVLQGVPIETLGVAQVLDAAQEVLR